MSKMDGLQQALRANSGKASPERPESQPMPTTANKPPRAAKPSSREGKEYTGAWLNPDFGTSLRLVQLHRRRNAEGKKVFLDDLIAEAFNDLFRKYDVPTVHHD